MLLDYSTIVTFFYYFVDKEANKNNIHNINSH